MTQVRQIESEESHSAESTQTVRQAGIWPWAMLKPFAGLAVAASVAVVSITLWQTSVNPQAPGDETQVVSVDQRKIEKLASQPMQGSAVTVSTNLGGGMRWNVEKDTPALQQKLNAYLVNHTEYSNSMQGLIPQARVAGFDAEQ